MAYEPVAEPVPFPEACRRTDPAAAQSQAAVLLTLANLLRYEDPTKRDPVEALDLAAAGQPPLAAPEVEEVAPEEDLSALGVPPSLLRLAGARGARVDARFSREMLASRDERFTAFGAELAPGPEAAAATDVALPALADDLVSDPSPVTAAALTEASLSHPDELVRVAAAAAALETRLPEQQQWPLEVLIAGAGSDDDLVREVAATALARVAPSHPRLLDLILPGPSSGEGEPSRTSLLVHGTWARMFTWWQPGHAGNFHAYLKSDVDPDLYSAADRFDWSGAYSPGARRAGGLRLKSWALERGLDGLDLFTHSHGGSVSMVASREGLRIGRLVLLSCPVRREYTLDFSRVRKAYSIRVHLDLVILADGGGQRFRDPLIEEIVLPIWFQHSITHERETWVQHGLPQRISG